MEYTINNIFSPKDKLNEDKNDLTLIENPLDYGIKKTNVYNPLENLVENINESFRTTKHEFDLYNKKFKYTIKKGVLTCTHCQLEIHDIYTHCVYCNSFLLSQSYLVVFFFCLFPSTIFFSSTPDFLICLSTLLI
jgi:hypothetical protein